MHKCQQFELYAAEVGTPEGRWFKSVKEAGEWVNSLRDTSWWEQSYKAVQYVEVNASRDPKGSCGGWLPEHGIGQMDMHPTHLNELTLLHELAHVLAEYRYGSHAHCPWFARTYLELVSHVLGPETYLTLKNRFDEFDIDYDAETTTARGIAL